jgi:hypothetical protein
MNIHCPYGHRYEHNATLDFTGYLTEHTYFFYYYPFPEEELLEEDILVLDDTSRWLDAPTVYDFDSPVVMYQLVSWLVELELLEIGLLSRKSLHVVSSLLNHGMKKLSPGGLLK